VYRGDTINLTLIATDSGVPHNWFLSFSPDRLQPIAGEPSSPAFNSSTPVKDWSFVADRSGNWTYRCRYHPTSMMGNVTILGGPSVNLREARTVPLITAIMLAGLGVVFVFAAVYHYRAVQQTKRKR
jgi:hypothetical protein